MRILNRIALTITSVWTLALPLLVTAEQHTVDRIEKAFNQRDVGTLSSMEGLVEGYDGLLVRYRLALSYDQQSEKDKVRAVLLRLISTLEKQASESPNYAESQALLASSYGLYIHYDASKAETFGPLSHTAIARALKLGPQNPQVLMMYGIIKFHTPTIYGGSKEEAKKIFKQALQLFPSSQNSGHYWGHAETHTWLGLTYLDQGNKNKAQEQWRQALQVYPSHKWAQSLLAQNSK